MIRPQLSPAKICPHWPHVEVQHDLDSHKFPLLDVQYCSTWREVSNGRLKTYVWVVWYSHHQLYVSWEYKALLVKKKPTYQPRLSSCGVVNPNCPRILHHKEVLYTCTSTYITSWPVAQLCVGRAMLVNFTLPARTVLCSLHAFDLWRHASKVNPPCTMIYHTAFFCHRCLSVHVSGTAKGILIVL